MSTLVQTYGNNRFHNVSKCVCDIKEGMEKPSTQHIAENESSPDPSRSTGETVRRVRFLGYAACAVAGCLWGTGFYFGRLALNEMSVEHMVLYRFLFASLGMFPLVVANRSRFHLTGGEIKLLVISAAFGIPIQFLLQFHGLALTTVSHDPSWSAPCRYCWQRLQPSSPANA